MRSPDALLKPGQQFHHLTIVKLSHSDKHGHRHYLCRCRCGVEKTVSRNSLVAKKNGTKSCGCWGKEAKNIRHLPLGEPAFNQVFAGYRHKAQKANLPFSLTKEEFKEIVKKNCFYCGKEPSNTNSNVNKRVRYGEFVYSGVDRIDPLLGYQIGNVVPCCCVCNWAKSDYKQEEFISWIKRAYEHLKSTLMKERWSEICDRPPLEEKELDKMAQGT